MDKNSYTSSKTWCNGCEEYRYDNYCTNKSAVAFGKRLGNSKECTPCWLVRGTVHCKRSENTE